jgi:hypothetical protein
MTGRAASLTYFAPLDPADNPPDRDGFVSVPATIPC